MEWLPTIIVKKVGRVTNFYLSCFLEHKGMHCYDYVCVGTASMSDICKVFHVFKVVLSFKRRGGSKLFCNAKDSLFWPV